MTPILDRLTLEHLFTIEEPVGGFKYGDRICWGGTVYRISGRVYDASPSQTPVRRGYAAGKLWE